MRFEWEEAKAAGNLVKHGVSFDEAATVFEDPLFVDFYDPAHSEDEHRFILIGESRGLRLLIVSYREDEEIVRIISARAATRSERKAYEEE